MNDRDKVISRLQIIRTWAEVGKNYDGIQGDGCLRDIVDWIDDALELLKAQEPRVLTLAEVESSDGSVWLERNMPEWETPIAVLVDKVGKYLDTFIAIGGLCFQGEKSQGQEYGNYGKTWRCWSSKPTVKQREAAPWTE